MAELFSELGINPPVLIAQLVSFILLFLLLRSVAYKRILKMFDERSRRIKESMELTEQVKEQAAHAEQEVKKQIEAASKQGQEIIARAMRTGEEVRQKAQEEARRDAEALLARARLEIQTERDGAIDELRREFADLTVLAAGKVIGKSLDREAHRELIEKVLEESTTLKKG